MTTRTENGWVFDEHDNKASIARWGSEERAAEILKSLENCSGCSDCSGCSGCSDCSGCSGLCSAKPVEQPVESGLMTIGGLPVPVIPEIHKRVWEAVSQENALDMSRWHGDETAIKDGAYCGTTHCRAGWVIALAGKAGRDLEQATSEVFAAMQIYKASGYDISPVRFFDSNEKAMADIKQLAEKAPVRS